MPSPSRDTLPPGTIVAGRFTLERLAGQGGVGLVYRAKDSVSGRTVALKLLHTIANSESAHRFAREAELLAQLHHSGIVSHVAHGLTNEHQPFLAMEWLEGEDIFSLGCVLYECLSGQPPFRGSHIAAVHQEEAGQLARLILETEKPNLLHQGVAHLVLARVALSQRELPVAEVQARRACELLTGLIPFQLIALRSLCVTLLAGERPAEAREVADRAIQALEQMGGEGSGAVGAWLSLAEAAIAQGKTGVEEKAMRKAGRILNRRAEDITDPVARERFMSRVPEHARIREVLRERWGIA